MSAVVYHPSCKKAALFYSIPSLKKEGSCSNERFVS
jgi:hypothetical protein